MGRVTKCYTSFDTDPLAHRTNGSFLASFEIATGGKTDKD